MKLCDILEGFRPSPLSSAVKDTLPATYIMPQLQNTDPYRQYRYVIALASAKSIESNDVTMEQESAWNESMAAICYTPEEEQIVKLANKHLNLKSELISTSRSEEPKFVNKVSTVRPFKDYDK